MGRAEGFSKGERGKGEQPCMGGRRAGQMGREGRTMGQMGGRGRKGRGGGGKGGRPDRGWEEEGEAGEWWGL